MLERAKGIEPSSQPWEGRILPLNHARGVLGHLIIGAQSGLEDFNAGLGIRSFRAQGPEAL